MCWEIMQDSFLAVPSVFWIFLAPTLMTAVWQVYLVVIPFRVKVERSRSQEDLSAMQIFPE